MIQQSIQKKRKDKIQYQVKSQFYFVEKILILNFIHINTHTLKILYVDITYIYICGNIYLRSHFYL